MKEDVAPVEMAARDHAHAAARALAKVGDAKTHAEFCKELDNAIEELQDAVLCQGVEGGEMQLSMLAAAVTLALK
jgi:hypothetical protein